MSTFIDELNDKLPTETAGALPSTRTFDMVTQALASDNIDEVKSELVHTRAHYQSLEYMLNGEDLLVETVKAAYLEGGLPAPTTVDEAIALSVRVLSGAAVHAAYENAHNVGFFVGVLGMNVQEGLQQIYSDLDFSDPVRELSEADLIELSGQNKEAGE